MKTVTEHALTVAPLGTFRGQDWVIMPVALAVNEVRPQSILQQRWELTLSGVYEIDYKCTSSNDWSGETANIFPDINGPLRFAINRYAIPVPATSPYVVEAFPNGITPLIQVEQMAGYAALGSIFDSQTAVNSGFSVNTWRPVHYLTLTDSTGGHAPAVPNIFQGIAVDVAARDNDAILYRVNYRVTIVGKIVFANYTGIVIP